MAARFGWRKSLERLTYDKKQLHKHALRIKKSLEELNQYMDRQQGKDKK
ncbi:MAG: hypothetical protein ACLU6W_07890 [Lachnospiraceae bacterium]|nr:hypothetical protein [Candidatus Fimimorpha excrementavium]